MRPDRPTQLPLQKHLASSTFYWHVNIIISKIVYFISIYLDATLMTYVKMPACVYVVKHVVKCLKLFLPLLLVI